MKSVEVEIPLLNAMLDCVARLRVLTETIESNAISHPRFEDSEMIRVCRVISKTDQFIKAKEAFNAYRKAIS